MIVKRPRDLLIKKALAHGFMLCFPALILFPLVVVPSISLRERNFAVGAIRPENPTCAHWYRVSGLSDGAVKR